MNLKISSRFYIISIIFLLLLHTSLSASTVYQCTDSENPITKVFPSLEKYKENAEKFRYGNNYVAFDVDKIPHLEQNVFIAQDSNFIRKLVLSGKELNIIDIGAFDELYCVKYLQLENNNVAELVNGTFKGLVNVEELNLSRNQLVSIPTGAFWQLVRLLKLDLSHNQIKKLSSDTFSSLNNLWELHLEHNNIIDLPSSLFLPLQRLRWLCLGSNRFSVPTSPDFRHLNQLDELNISNNGIAYIYEEMFDTLPKLSTLDLSRNRLNRLNIRALRIVMPGLKKLVLSDNSWECNDLDDMLKYMESSKIGVIINNITVYKNITTSEIGCYNGKNQISTSTTTVAPTITTKSSADINIPGDSSMIQAIDDLKSVIIVLITIVVIFIAIDVVVRVNLCSLFSRRRGMVLFSDDRSPDPSLPLLSR